MKTFTLLSFLFFISIGLHAQITVTNSGWPKVGDTLKIAADNSPSYALVPAQTTNANWDFSDLKKNNIDLTIFENASAGSSFAQFPGADLVVKSNVAETYYNKTAAKFEILGFVGDFAGFGFPLTAKYSPPNVERRNPMHYFDINTATYSFTTTFSAAFLPDSLTNMFPTFDSIRFGQSTSRLDVVDSWGKLKIPEGSFDILREKRTLMNSFKIEVKIPILGWFDLSTFGGAGLVPPADTSVSYVHFADGILEPILILNCNSTGDSIQDAQFRSLTSNVGVFDPKDRIASLKVFPNPASNFINIKMTDLAQGDYSIILVNLLGQTCKKENLNYPGQIFDYNLNIDGIDPGWYIVSLKNKNDVVTASGTVIITK
ncbi:MAG TPA: T9SS type A sorting domain-containing protein [Saprospiraceae bacterium]|nr:T9SS type A sorting domain-containing protein [Saprospiraceae bacterium]